MNDRCELSCSLTWGWRRERVACSCAAQEGNIGRQIEVERESRKETLELLREYVFVLVLVGRHDG
jgi:hypothetical protein